ncbi:CRE-SUT-2 protein [Aphelenchoides avenae]|nr:CRE-SUT-2 protein [Aphelenchus avenae]
MSTQNTEFTKKLRAAIRAKIEELGLDVDEELPDYVMVMVANKKTSERMKNDLKLFLGKDTPAFVDWLFSFFEKVQNSASVTTEPSDKPSKSTSSKNDDEQEQPKERTASHEKRPKEETRSSEGKSSGEHRHRRSSEDASKSSSHKNSEKESSRGKLRHDSKSSHKNEEPTKSSRRARDSRSPSPVHEKSKRKPITYDVSSEDSSRGRHHHSRSSKKERRRDDDYSPEDDKKHRRDRHASHEDRRHIRYEEPRQHHQDRYSDSDDELSPRRHTVHLFIFPRQLKNVLQVKSKVIAPTKSEAPRPKLSSQVVVKQPAPPPRPAPELVKGSSTLFKRALSGVVSGESEKRKSVMQRIEYADEVLQVGLESQANRRTVMDDEDDELDDESRPQSATRFIVRVGGSGGRRLTAEEDMDELDEGKETPEKMDAQDTSPTDADRRERRKRRADDPTRAFLQLSGINRIKATRDAADSTVSDLPTHHRADDDADRPSRKKARALKVKTEADASEVSSTGPTKHKRSPPDAKAPITAVVVPVAGEGKAKERCRFWPECRHGDACFYHHPVKPCMNFPNCYYGDKCLYMHPPCRFGKSCMKANCAYTHYTQASSMPVTSHPVHTAAPPAIKMEVAPVVPLAKGPAVAPQGALSIPCRYGGRCQNPACAFKHPKPCHYGTNCLNDSCPFYHPPAGSKHANRTWVASSVGASAST